MELSLALDMVQQWQHGGLLILSFQHIFDHESKVFLRVERRKQLNKPLDSLDGKDVLYPNRKVGEYLVNICIGMANRKKEKLDFVEDSIVDEESQVAKVKLVLVSSSTVIHFK